MEQLDVFVGSLRAVAEETRLRLLALCADAELTVTELTRILGQSQPRVSRHLRLLVEAGLLTRFREGTWSFYGLSMTGASADLARRLLDFVPRADPVFVRDRERLEEIKRDRAEEAATYFRENAPRWNEIRSLYVDETEVESALLDAVGPSPIERFLDVGTGTGRILEIFAARVRQGLGIDLSREMLAVARAMIEQRNLRHCQVRHADMYALPLPDRAIDFVAIHQVLHFADAPSAAIAESARVLRPGGRMAVVDFAPHDLEYLREKRAHRRLGFSDTEIAAWYEKAGLTPLPVRRLAGNPLTVSIWMARRPGVPQSAVLENHAHV
jgi:ubiquinone/menaquinone biosynthesis C-methylase UbiE